MLEDAMKKSNIVSFLIICIFSVMLVGCNKKEEMVTAQVETEEKNMFGLTESEQKMYAEYAAGVLMKYNAGSNMRVLEGQRLIQQEAKEQAAKEQAEKRAQLAAEYEANKNSDNHEDKNKGGSSSGNSNTTQKTEVSYISDMSVATGTNAFSIHYDGYEIADSYPNSGEDVFFAMDATNGNLLMVTKYKVTNISGQTQDFDMFSQKAKFRLDLDGKKYKSQYTLLLNDLSMYKGNVEAGAVVDTVLVFEIPESAASSVNDMVLTISVGDKVDSMRLTGSSGNTWTTTEVEESMEQEETGDVSEGVEEIIEDNGEYNDLAQEYMDALESENSDVVYEDDNEGGNVTIVGSGTN